MRGRRGSPRLYSPPKRRSQKATRNDQVLRDEGTTSLGFRLPSPRAGIVIRIGRWWHASGVLYAGMSAPRASFFPFVYVSRLSFTSLRLGRFHRRAFGHGLLRLSVLPHGSERENDLDLNSQNRYPHLRNSPHHFRPAQ